MLHKKNLFFSIILLCANFMFSQGSKGALNFDGTNDYVEIANNAVFNNYAGAGGVITVEAWVKVLAINTDASGQTRQPVISKGNSGAWQWALYIGDNLSVGSSFWQCSGSSHNEVTTAANSIAIGEWNHLAIVYDRISGFNRVYINGIQSAERTVFSGTACTGTRPVRIASREGGGQYLNAEIDEVKVWDSARTEAQIRTNMCKKLIGSETNLSAYWRFDDGSGITLDDLTTNNLDGTLTSMVPVSDWVTSGAAIGDESAFNYPVSWSGQTVSLTSTNKGNLEINTVTGTPDGVHIYRVDQTPNTITGITNTIGSNDIYYGVFVVNGSAPTYTSAYNYTNYPAANANEPYVEIYNRADNTITSWSALSATADFSANTLTKTLNSGRSQEYLIGGINSSEILGYLGPGGVGHTDGTSNLVVWLNANDLDADGDVTDNPANGSIVSAWNDLSGYGYNYSQGTAANQPTYTSSSINSYPATNFDGSDFINGTDNTYNEGTALFVLNASDFTSRSRLLNKSGSTSLRFEQWNNTGNIGYTRYGVADYNTGISAPFGLDAILSYTKLTTASNSYDIRKLTNSSETTNTLNVGSSTAPIPIVEFGNFTNGNVSEIIVYNKALNTAQKIITDNYLSAKYGLILQNNDFYTQDNGGTDFDHDVAGIGQAIDGTNHTNSQGTGIVRMYNPSGLANDEFLFWGRNNKTTYAFATNTSTYTERISSNWRVSKRNDLGTVTVDIDLTGVNLSGKLACAPLKLVVDNNSDLASPTSSYTLTNISGNIYRADGVIFADNDYFTVEYIDQIVVDNSQFYNGSGAANVPNTSDDCYKLLVKSTATGALGLTENADVREVEVEASGKLVVNTATRLQVTNGVALNGEIRLMGTSQLLQTHTGVKQITGTGNLYKDQEGISTTVYQSGYWTSPVTTNGSTFTIKGVLKDGTTVTSASSNPTDINFIDGHNGAKTIPITISKRWLAKLINATDWTRYVDPVTETFNPGEGWNMKSTGSGTQNFTFKGIPNDGTYTSTINQNTLSLIGNPYPSAIDADQFITANTSAITGTLYFYDATNDTSHNRGAYTGGYATRVLGVGTPFSGGSTPGQYIPVGQAFFVTRDLAGSGTITFENSQRAFQVRGASSQFFSKNKNTSKEHFIKNKTKSSLPILRLGFEFNITETKKYHRQLAVAFRGVTSNYEAGFDAEMFDRQPTDIGLKVFGKTTPFVITGIEKFAKNLQIPLYVYLDKKRNVSFSIDGLDNLTTNVYLRDVLTNQYYNLTEENKTISLDLDSGTYSDRFFISFSNTVLSVDEENVLSKNVLIYVDKKTKELVVKPKNSIEIKQVKVFSILGQEVLSSNKVMKENVEHRINLEMISGAIYIVKLETNKGLFSKKVVIFDKKDY